ncbi:MAG: hypothetical protein JNK46_03520 [Methylobacteriaceae bacterium]|nr:hypothetical protein [Methylobacteriaceae bacterium]
MIARALAGLFALGLTAAAAAAGHRHVDSDYPGSWAIADGHGEVAVKVQYLAMGACWRIENAREGVPDRATAEPNERHLYVTVAIRKTGDDCPPTNAPLETKLNIPDKPGRISLDVFFVDERGVLQRSQRHRIERDCGASTTTAC